ncbi:hypothetical protein CROQUDRAFT_659462 [Cronartium quercuum f. sp. fusiforme G11]|uniref:Mannose-6-phosphate isomerase n=1 Tax=Cronartium quercuum f. sp. fusiforme G11 TaxID=708437 RepID=A0A9P6NDS8_9BASI|nr:hypothetical protein CROQUDRAFT_659462 [Cronartium quercuum f. sp. fusiforme G11]
MIPQAQSYDRGKLGKDGRTFCTYMLNLVHLQPGQAAFLSANEPHAYLSGGEPEPLLFIERIICVRT